MEEVDKIIIHTLRTIGCDIEDDVESLHQFSTEIIVEATVRCLKVINNVSNLPHTLPPGMSARFRMGTSLATALTDLGYRGEIGYQTFLYSNEADVRRVFMFLIEKLPKESADTPVDESLGASALLQRNIAAEVARRLSCPWTPPFCKVKNICWRGKPPVWHKEGCSSVHNFHSYYIHSPHGLGDLTTKIPKEKRSYYNKDLEFISKQPPHHHCLPSSVMESNAVEITAQHEWEAEWNQAGLASRLTQEEFKARKRQRLQKKIEEQLREGMQKGQASIKTTSDLKQLLDSMRDRSSAKSKGSRFTHTEKLQFAQDGDKMASQIGEGPKMDTEEELKQKREDEMKLLRDELDGLSEKIENLDIEIKKHAAGKEQMEEEIETLKNKNKDSEDSYKVKKRTLDLLPDAENNIAKLQSVVDASSERLINLASQWEKHRVPLIDQYRELKHLSEGRVSESEKMLEEIKDLRQQMKTFADMTRGKEDLYKQLVQEYERMTKDVNRSAYTKRILEIVGNIKKQKHEIDKVLIDTKAIQKEINQLSGKLDRTFTVTDELIFRDAKKDEAVRKAYKYLAALHENCDLLIKTVEDTGVIMREIRELEDQIENESNKKVLSNLEKISSDLQEMKNENTTLLAKLKKS